MTKATGFFMLCKSASQLFPSDRPFTELEALASFELDANNGKDWTVRGYARVWGWEKNRTRRFIQGITSREGLSQSGKRVLTTPIRIITNNTIDRRPTSAPPAPHQNPAIPGVSEGQRPGSAPPAPRTIKTKNKDLNTCTPHKRFDPIAYRPSFIPEEQWLSFIDNRKFKKLQNSEAALKVICKNLLEAVERGHRIEECIGAYVTSKWQRFDADWLDSRQPHSHQQETNQAVKNCANCSYNQDQGEPCTNIGKPGYPESCRSFIPFDRT